MSAELEKSKEQEGERYPYIGEVGATGAGKTELSKVLKYAWKEVNIFEEKYGESPFIKKFYKNPRKWSFKHERWFLEAKISQMASLKPLLFEKMQVHDPALWLDTEVYAAVQHEMGWMSKLEYKTYLMAAESLTQRVKLPEPDLIIAAIASPETVLKRIIDRAEKNKDDPVRQRELDFIERYPDYFPRLAEKVIEWVAQNSHGVPIVEINTEKYNYVLNDNDRLEVLKYLRDFGSYNLFGPPGNGRGRDGARLIFPNVLRPPVEVTYGDKSPHPKPYSV